MLLKCLRTLLFISLVAVWPVVNLHAADFYVAEHRIGWRELWQAGMPLDGRLAMLTKDGLYVFMKGPIVHGDYAVLTSIHSLVPIHTLMISSPGGSVADALKIAEFVGNYHIQVETDWGCKGAEVQKVECGCASSCAFIWLAAPLRDGDVIKMHRPYFDGTSFPSLPDAKALQIYNEAANSVRSLLQSRGYSQEFLATVFRIPREKAKQLTSQEIASLPIDVALDEVVSARCYHGNEKQIGSYQAIDEEITRLTKEYDNLTNILPYDLEDYELRRDARYRKDYSTWKGMAQRLAALKASAERLRAVYNEFQTCKRRERIQASLRKSGQELTPELRAMLNEFRAASARLGSTALIAKYAPDHPVGKEAAEDLKQRQTRIGALWQQLRLALPSAHRDFIAAAIK